MSTQHSERGYEVRGPEIGAIGTVAGAAATRELTGYSHDQRLNDFAAAPGLNVYGASTVRHPNIGPEVHLG